MAEKKSFETLYRELEDTIRRLESGDLPLADALELYAESARLAEQCNTILDQAELRVRELTVHPDGSLASQEMGGQR